jgi:hypothetical protein
VVGDLIGNSLQILIDFENFIPKLRILLTIKEVKISVREMLKFYFISMSTKLDILKYIKPESIHFVFYQRNHYSLNFSKIRKYIFLICIKIEAKPFSMLFLFLQIFRIIQSEQQLLL